MEITYQLTEDDYRQGYKAYKRRTKFSLWISHLSYLVFVLVLAVTLFVLIVGPDRSFSTLFPLLFFVAFWMWCIWYAPYRVARKMIKGSPGAALPHTAEFSADGLHFRTTAGESRLNWNLFTGWSEADRVFALFPSPVTFVPIPKRAMTAAQQEELRSLMRSKLMKSL
jgi:YcxB-like protein